MTGNTLGFLLMGLISVALVIAARTQGRWLRALHPDPVAELVVYLQENDIDGRVVVLPRKFRVLSVHMVQEVAASQGYRFLGVKPVTRGYRRRVVVLFEKNLLVGEHAVEH